MSNQTIPNLVAATSLNGTEQLYAVQSGADVRVTTAQIAGLNPNISVGLVAALPPASVVGARAFVTDANATTFAAIVAGTGSNKVPVYSDGTNWRIG